MATATSPKYPGVEVQLTGEDGNGFFIIGRVQRALRKHLREQGMSAKDTDAVIAQFQDEAASGNYDHLLVTVMQWVNVN